MGTKTFEKRNLSCGLDFGTSNSVISITDLSTREEIFTFSLQSILYFPESDPDICYVGKEAEERYVADGMRGRLLKSVKTLMKQDKFLFTWIGGRRVTPEQMATFIIRRLKEKAEAFLGLTLDRVVLGRPAIFSEKREEEETAVRRLLAAAREAGFEEVRLCLEPIAAAFSYEGTLREEQVVLIADFGGGTSDFSIIRLSPDRARQADRSGDILAHGGLYIGGDLFDSEIMWYKVTPLLGRGVAYKTYDGQVEVPNILYRELKHWERSFLLKESRPRRQMDKYYVFSGQDQRINNVRVLIDRNYVYSLFKAIERSKIELSDRERSMIRFVRPDLRLEEPIAFGEYEAMIACHIHAIRDYVRRLMADSGYETGRIDSVYLTGGSSLSKPVRELFYGLFGEERVHTGDTFHSVARGLSLSLSER